MTELKKENFNDFEFYTIYRMKFILMDDVKTIEDVIERVESALNTFKLWKKEGVQYSHGAEDDYASFKIKGIDKAVKLGFEGYTNDRKKVLEWSNGELYLDENNDPIEIEEYEDNSDGPIRPWPFL